jgi:hypothetical protein
MKGTGRGYEPELDVIGGCSVCAGNRIAGRSRPRLDGVAAVTASGRNAQGSVLPDIVAADKLVGVVDRSGRQTELGADSSAGLVVARRVLRDTGHSVATSYTKKSQFNGFGSRKDSKGTNQKEYRWECPTLFIC